MVPATAEGAGILLVRVTAGVALEVVVVTEPLPADLAGELLDRAITLTVRVGGG